MTPPFIRQAVEEALKAKAQRAKYSNFWIDKA
jgi:hypothetical protein